MFSREIGTLQDAIEYFNTHPHLFQREDYDKGHMERVMAVLTQENMEHLEKQFQLYPRGLELPTFIYLIKKLYNPEHEISKYFFVSDLIKFFQAIDINGDGHLEWSEFTEYIIQNIRVVEKPRYKNKAFEENEIISTAYSKISNEYKMAKIHDLNCQSTIRKILYDEERQSYYLIQSQTHFIRVFNRKFQQTDSIFLQPEIKSKNQTSSTFKLQSKAKYKKSTIVDFSLDKNLGIIGCIFEDCLFFCNVGVKAAGNSVNCQNSVCYKKYDKIQYLPQHKMWCVTSKYGQLQLFTVSYTSRILTCFKPYKNLHPHESSLTQILETSEPLCLATSSMDGNIKLYSNHLQKYYTFEHITEQTSSIINENKKKGILGISYTSQFGNYILGFGFSNSIHVYSLDISMTKGYLGKYGQHTGSILWAKFIKGYPNVLSFDDKMNMRIWDFRKFHTIQFINCEKIFINPSRLELIPELHQILICEKKLTQFKAPALEKKSKQLNEFHNIFNVKFSSLTHELYIFTSNDVRIYNYYTGCLKKLFTKLYSPQCQTNITACQFGFKCRRFFIGDAGGYVRQFCSQTGDQLQSISPGDQIHYENKQIKEIMFMKEHGVLVCCSIDGRVMIYERNQEGQFIIVRDFRQCHDQFVVGAVSERYCLLATAGDNGDLFVWNLEKYILQGVCVLNSKPVGIAFSPIHPIMIVATQDGYLNFFYVKPYQGKQRYKCFTKISINQISGQLNKKGRRIISFHCQLIVNAYFPKQCYLTTHQSFTSSPNIGGLQRNHHLIAAIGTDDGKIITMNLNNILEMFKIEENHQIFIMKNCHRCEVQNLKTVSINERNRIINNSGYSNSIKNIHHIDQFVHCVIDVADGPIENITISKECSALFCKSNDKKLRVYSFKNEYNGAINFLTFKKIFWKIPQVNFFKKLQAIDTTIYSIKLIENKKFKPEQEMKVKVHLLLNEYLSNKEKQHYFNWLSSKKVVVEQQKVGKPKIKKIENTNECLTEQEFRQIYNKLKYSIEKSLQNHNNNDKIFWERPLLKSKSRMVKQSQITQSTNREREREETTLNFDESYKFRLRSRKNTRRDENCSVKIKTKSSIKFDPSFELFGQRAESPKKKSQTKKRNMLFTPLSTAKKIIMSNFSGTLYR